MKIQIMEVTHQSTLGSGSHSGSALNSVSKAEMFLKTRDSSATGINLHRVTEGE